MFFAVITSKADGDGPVTQINYNYYTRMYMYVRICIVHMYRIMYDLWQGVIWPELTHVK